MESRSLWAVSFDFFPELRSLGAACKFYNFTHLHELGCAVLQALEKGTIAASRYKSYQAMLKDESVSYELSGMNDATGLRQARRWGLAGGLRYQHRIAGAS